MRDVQQRLTERWDAAVFAPARAFRWSYLPPMMVYFAAGAVALTGIATAFWVKKGLTLTPSDLAGLAVWLGLPAVMKMVIGELVDTVPVFGSQRRSYIFIGAGLVAAAMLLLAGSSSGWLTLSPDRVYVSAMLLTAIGIVVQDVAADAMTTEVVPTHETDGTARAKSDIEADLAMVQVLGRLFFSAGLLSVSFLGGWLASIWSYEKVFLAGLVVPLIAISGALLVKIDTTEHRPTDWTLLGGGLAFGVVVLMLGLLSVPGAQEITFVISLTVIVAMLMRITAGIDAGLKRKIFYAALIIFWFRAYPIVGDGMRWFLIDRYGFDELFFGKLDTIGALLMFATAWLLSSAITRMRTSSLLMTLTFVSTLLAVPGLILVFEPAMSATAAVTGLGPRSLAIIDTAVQSPIVNLSMIPMLTLIAVNAPAKSRAVWFALMASFMNVALTAGDLMTKYLNMIFVIERGNYANLPALTVWVTIIAFVLPLTAICIWRRHID